MRLVVDARCLAALRAERAVAALVLVEADFQEREAGQERQQRSHRADGVAVGSTTTPGQHEKYHYSHNGTQILQQNTLTYCVLSDKVTGCSMLGPHDCLQQVTTLE